MKTTLFIILLICLNTYSQWQTDVRLTNAPLVSSTSRNNAWCVASSGNDVHVVWHDNRSGGNNYGVYYKRSTDGGISWGIDTRITQDSSVYPTVAISGQIVHVAWERSITSDIYYKRSTDGGLSWGAQTHLTNAAGESSYPSLSISGSSVHLVWRDDRDGNTEIYYKRSTDAGISWETDTRLTNNPAFSWFPSVSVSGQIVLTVWEDERDGNSEIYCKRSSDGGISWSADTRLTTNSAISTYPSVSFSGSNVHIVWSDNRDGTLNYEIYYKRSTDGGAGWEADTRLTNAPTNSWNSSIAVSGSNAHIVWRDDRDGNSEIYHKRSTNGGINWETDARLTNNTAVSDFPSVSVSGSSVHVVWRDERDGNQEIYYKQNPTGNPASVFQSVFSRNNLNKPITDNANTLDTISVNFTLLVNFSVLDVNLRIDTVLHTNDSDLEFFLIHNGINDTVIFQAGGSGDNYIGTVLNDSASALISSGSSPFTGSFKPHKPLSQFNTGDINGTWILKIFDRATGNIGTLKAWSLVFTVQNNTIGIQNISNQIPNGFALSQNYPNPFNPKTVISFQLAVNSFAKLIIYDILGSEVTTLFNEQLKPGIYEVDWDASNYPSGVYFYRIETESFSESKKMILIK